MRIRFLFLALLIALLPMRGWIGDVMAMERSTAALAQAGQHHAMTMVNMAEAHADCPGHAGAQSEPAATPMTDDCGTCTTCQLCHAPALTVATPSAPQLPHIRALPHAPASAFASAERAPGFKPPIS